MELFARSRRVVYVRECSSEKNYYFISRWTCVGCDSRRFARSNVARTGARRGFSASTTEFSKNAFYQIRCYDTRINVVAVLHRLSRVNVLDRPRYDMRRKSTSIVFNTGREIALQSSRRAPTPTIATRGISGHRLPGACSRKEDRRGCHRKTTYTLPVSGWSSSSSAAADPRGRVLRAEDARADERRANTGPVVTSSANQSGPGDPGEKRRRRSLAAATRARARRPASSPSRSARGREPPPPSTWSIIVRARYGGVQLAAVARRRARAHTLARRPRRTRPPSERAERWIGERG